jgi:hypothetical protein
VSNGWGLSPAGGTWLNLLGTDANFSVDGSRGLILTDTANVGRYCSLHDDAVADINATATVTLTKAAAGASSSVGMTLGYQDSSNHYRARLLFGTAGSVQLALEVVVGGTTTTLGALTSVGSGFTANQLWHIRAQRTGTTLRCRAWLHGSTEPTTWTHSVTDTTYPTGRVGFRSLASTGSTAIPYNAVVDDLVVTETTWATPPSVTHRTWVRALPTPFTGTWTDTLAAQIRTWAASAQPDALAYAAMFTAGAPTVNSAALGGPVYGQALYGPTAADGTRVEFSDWNDFAGVGWTYPDGEVRTFPHGDVISSGGLDCSGYVRIIYGRGLGVPMVFDLNFDGINLPRRTRDMGPSGPGVVVGQGHRHRPAPDRNPDRRPGALRRRRDRARRGPDRPRRYLPGHRRRRPPAIHLQPQNRQRTDHVRPGGCQHPGRHRHLRHPPAHHPPHLNTRPPACPAPDGRGFAMPGGPMPNSRGLDVSSYQAVQDWKALASNGLTFAIRQSQRGRHTPRDSRFVNHIDGIIRAGLVPGAYHFAWPNQSAATRPRTTSPP